jgi:hypothetical protein
MHGAALWGFIGTLAGAIVGAAAAISSAELLQRREDKRRMAERRRDANQAFRLLSLDVGAAIPVLKACYEAKAWWADDIQPDMQAWRAHLDMVAHAMPTQDAWERMAEAFRLMQFANTVRVADESFTGQDGDVILAALTACNNADVILAGILMLDLGKLR